MTSFIRQAAIMMMAAPLAVAAQDAKISIIDRTHQRNPVITIQSKYDFEQAISLKLKTSTSSKISDVLITTLSKIGMTDARGIKITSGFDVDPKHDLVVAYSGGTSEIIKTARSPRGLQVIGSFKDKQGNFISPPADKLAIYSTSGEKLCFDYQSVQKNAPKIGITLLLDRSGSMAGHIDDVKKSAQAFLNALPKGAECAVGSFNSTAVYAHKKYQSCTGGGFGFESIEASGGTDIYAALKGVYTVYERPYFKDHQKATIIITDGYTLSNEARKKELLALKKDILTFVYFIGGDKRDDIEALTDHFLAKGGNVKQSLSQYFGAIGQAYNSQKVLNVRPCHGSHHAKP